MDTIQQVTALLRSKGFSPAAIKTIRYAFIDDAIENARDVHADRIYTMVALMLYDCFGFEHEDIFAGLKRFEELHNKIVDGTAWHEMMEELREKTGIVVRSESDNRIAFEYDPEE